MLLRQLTLFLAQSTFSQVLKTEKLSIKMLKSFQKELQSQYLTMGTNESRALTLLQTAGLIKLDVKDGELATIKNISENPKKLDIKEISAEQAAQTLSSVDAAVVNNSYAQQQNVNYDTTPSSKKNQVKI